MTCTLKIRVYLSINNEFILFSKGNENKFAKIEDCLKTCKPKSNIPKICKLKKSPGVCRGRNKQAGKKRFFFDKKDKKCKSFTYSGCRGAVNFQFFKLDSFKQISTYSAYHLRIEKAPFM